MSIPSIFDWLEYAAPLRGNPAVFIILITSIFIAVFWDWRLSLFALIVQYLVASLLFVDLLDPRLAIIKLLVGMFVCLILYLTARQIDYGKIPEDLTVAERKQLFGDKKIIIGRWALPRRMLTRIIATAIALLAIWLLTSRFSFSLPGIPDNLAHINRAILILMGLGLVGITTSRHALPAGMGLYTFLTGFELYYATLEQSIVMLAALAAFNMTIALAVAYLSQAQKASWYLLNDD